MAGRFWCDNADLELIKEVGPTAFALLIYLRRHVHGCAGDVDGNATGHRAIKDALGFHHTTTTVAAARLEQCGRIQIIHRPGRQCLYRICSAPFGKSEGYLSENPKGRPEPVGKSEGYLSENPKGVIGKSEGSLHVMDSLGIREGIESASLSSSPLGLRPPNERIREWFADWGRPEEADNFIDAMTERGWVTYGNSPVPIIGAEATMAAARKWIRRADQFVQDRANGHSPKGPTRPVRPWKPNLVTEADLAMTKTGRQAKEQTKLT